MKKTIFTRGFKALLVTQFLGACNDNLLKQIIALQVVAGIWREELGKGGQGVVTVIFTLPFILFSGWSGQIADRISKPRLTKWVKLAEIFLALAAIVALWIQSLTLAMLVLLFLALQSTVFGPAKYGMLPELFPESDLGRANGAINMFTYAAIILGAFLGGVLSDHYPASRMAPGLVLLLVAVAGFAASKFLAPLPAYDPSVRLSKNPFAPYWLMLRLMIRRRYLMVIALGWAFFDIIGVLVLQAILDFKLLLGLTDKETSLLNLPLLAGVGLGSALAGILSKGRIRAGLIPIGAAGIALFFVFMGLISLTLPWTVILLFGLGIFGGLYVVPLQALIQAKAPPKMRGRVTGTTNFLGFSFIAAGGALYWFLRAVLHLSVQPLLLICGAMTLAATGYLVWRIRLLFTHQTTLRSKEGKSSS